MDQQGAITQADQLLEAMKPIPLYMGLHAVVYALVFFIGVVFIVLVVRRTRTFFCKQLLVILGMWVLAQNAVPDFMWKEPIWQQYLAPVAKGMATAMLFVLAGSMYCLHYLPKKDTTKQENTEKQGDLQKG